METMFQPEPEPEPMPSYRVGQTVVVSPDAKHVKKELRGKELKLTKVVDGRLDFTVKGIRGYKGGSIAADKVVLKPVLEQRL